MFSYHTTIRMNNVDAAQRLFFAEQFVIAHDAWEAYLEAHGTSIRSLLEDFDFVTPIVHAESDYTAPMKLGDRVVVAVECAEIGTKSFTMKFRIAANDVSVGQVTHVHATVDKASGAAVPVPGTLRELLGRKQKAEMDVVV